MNLALAQSSDLDDESRRDEARQLRGRIRRGEHDGLTTGLAPGMVQLNLAILPQDWAEDFQRFCELNPKPCPLVSMTDPGNPVFPSEIGEGIDVRTDAPRYLVFRNGVLADEITDLGDIWQDDFVAFGMGCSYSFEEAIGNSGVPQPYLEGDECVPCYVTNIDCTPANPFNGKLVVSMRSFRAADAIRVIQISDLTLQRVK